jgi:hypothetical protein
MPLIKKKEISLIRFAYLLMLACLYQALKFADKLKWSIFSPSRENDRERTIN